MAQKSASADARTVGPQLPVWKFILPALITLVVLAALAYWGGMPPASETPKFLLGILVLAVVALAIGTAAWHLLFRPLPGVQTGAPGQSLLSAGQRLWMGTILVISLSMQAVGGVWDEIWHTRYGIPFGEDFFWRPHILIYMGLLAIVLMAGIAWYAILAHGKGSLPQRFRTDPLLGLLVLMGIVFLYAIPADPIWHTIYGSDLSAFSIPHVLLAFLTSFALIVGVGLIVSGRALRSWRTIAHLQMGDVLAIVAFASLLLATMMLLIVDWFGLSAEDVARGTSLVFQRPDWLPVLFIVALAVFTGVLANQTLRVHGAALLVGLAAFAARLILVNALGHVTRSADAWLVCLPPMLAVDVAVWLRARRGEAPLWWLNGLAAALAMTLVSLPLLNGMLPYPKVTAGNIAGMVVAITLGALAASWLGTAVGSYITARRPVGSADAPVPARQRLAIPAALAVAVVFIVVFVVTASPPVAG